MLIKEKIFDPLKRSIRIGLYIFALSLPFDFSLKNIGIYLPFIKTLLTFQIVVLLFFWEIFIFFERRLRLKMTTLALPIFVFFLIHLYSSIVSDKIVWSLKYTFRFFGLGLIYFLMVNFIENEKQIKTFVNCLFISTGVSAICVILQYFFPYSFIPIQNFFEEVNVSPHRIRGLFGWPTNMSCYLGSFLPILLSFLFYKPHKKFWGKFFYSLLTFLIMISLILSRTRGWILGLFCSLCFLWLLDSLRKKEYFTLGVVLVILILGLLFNFKGIEKFLKTKIEPSEQARITFFKEAIKVFKDHPVRGIGTDMFYWRHTPGFRAHSLFFETLVNLGIIGVLGLFWFLYTVFRLISRDITKRDPKEIYIRIGVFASLISFLVYHQIDYFLNIHEFVGLFWVLVGLGVCSLEIEKGGIIQ